MSDPAVIERTRIEAEGQAARRGEGMSEIGFPAMAALQIAFGLLLLAIWQIASGWLIDPFFISSPSEHVILCAIQKATVSGQRVNSRVKF